MGFPGSSAGKESACNAGDPGLTPGSGRSPGEGIGYPLQYSWGSLVAQMVKNLPVMWETWVRSLYWEDPLEEGMATHSSILAWRIKRTEEPGGLHCIASQRAGHNWIDLECRQAATCWILLNRMNELSKCWHHSVTESWGPELSHRILASLDSQSRETHVES